MATEDECLLYKPDSNLTVRFNTALSINYVPETMLGDGKSKI